MNIIHYIVGWFRYLVYYSKYKKYLRPHILEQIKWRIEIMDQECYNNGSCKKCGCSTTALQMANKMCGKPCYPKLMPRSYWNSFNKYRIPTIYAGSLWRYDLERVENGYLRHIILKENKIVHTKEIDDLEWSQNNN